ncbi:ATP-binding cassette domain-containing protein [Candidatus Peregrinibacteria bacterium]|jgi:cell division transport system ATP-binding protein|nr:ATP-binding cassette domain-containing protein [Candidatus Peregrinibacteria bacterium]MBT4056476.1 ATP-binding cassette domain-containing protein [Candidatus Peregrinibacteria bacterium]
MIEFLKITKRYGRTTVLDDITLDIEQGEFVTITGPSGAGKTTLIYALIGAEKLSKGKVIVDGFDVTKAKPSELQDYRRKIGIVFQDYKLLPRKTVYENIAFALEVCGYSKKEIQKRTMEAMRITGLEELRNNYPSQLSGGEKQRTAIARSLIHAPNILVADEPTGNLDEDNTKKIVQLLLKINKSGTTVLLATHDKEVIKMIKGREIRINKGHLTKS